MGGKGSGRPKGSASPGRPPKAKAAATSPVVRIRQRVWALATTTEHDYIAWKTEQETTPSAPREAELKAKEFEAALGSYGAVIKIIDEEG